MTGLLNTRKDVTEVPVLRSQGAKCSKSGNPKCNGFIVQPHFGGKTLAWDAGGTNDMHERLWRQRRRLIVTFVICALAGFLAHSTGGFGAILQGFQAGVLGMATTALVLVALPEMRWLAFKLAVIGLICAVLTLVFPTWFVLFLGALGVVFLPSQPWALDRFRVPTIFKAHSQVPVSLDRNALWSKIYPSETNEHWDPFLRGIREGRSDDTYFFVYEAMSSAGELQVPVKVFDVEPGIHFKTRDLSQPDASEGGPVIVTSHVVEPNGDGAMLTLMEATWRPMLWTAFSQWLDDYLGDHTDRLVALLEGRRDWSLKGASVKSLTENAGAHNFGLMLRSEAR